MRLGEAIKQCKPTGYVFKTNNPNIKYYKDHEKTIVERVLENLGSKGLYYKDFECFDPEQKYNIYEKVMK